MVRDSQLRPVLLQLPLQQLRLVLVKAVSVPNDLVPRKLRLLRVSVENGVLLAEALLVEVARMDQWDLEAGVAEDVVRTGHQCVPRIDDLIL